MANELKVGDVVRLKSGGPQMTIEEIDDSVAFCVWFERNKPESKRFNLAVLEKADDGPGRGPSVVSLSRV